MTLQSAIMPATAAQHSRANRRWILNKRKTCGAGLSRSPNCLHNSTCSLQTGTQMVQRLGRTSKLDSFPPGNPPSLDFCPEYLFKGDNASSSYM